MKVVFILLLRVKMKVYFDLVSKFMEVIVVLRNNNDDDVIVIMLIKEYNLLKEMEYLFFIKMNRNRFEEFIE